MAYTPSPTSRDVERSEMINNTPMALRSIPVWMINYQRLYLWRKIRPEVLRPGVWRRIRMPGF